MRAARERRERAQEKHGGHSDDTEESQAGAHTPRPADSEETPAQAPPPTGPSPTDPSPSLPRPGDAAREALRRALPLAREAVTEAGPSEAVPQGSAGSGGVPARPADVAREALRAARRESRQARAEGEHQEADPTTRRPRRTATPAAAPAATRTPSASRASRPRAQEPGGVVEALRARAVRDLVADAFRMPQDEDFGSEPAGDNDHALQASRDVQPPNLNLKPKPTPDLAAQDALTTPRPPTSMASPTRDGDLRRTFPAFPPRPSKGTSFAETWWGNAWVTALEEGALDAKRLVRGRGYAEKGHVDAITVTPGLVLAYVQGSRPRPYRVQVRLRTLDDVDWDRFLDAAADRPGNIAALLDKEMPKSLAECGVPLLPGPGDLDPRCSCPDVGHPCKHAAALCYQTARLLDADPFVLLLLRGRGERPLLDALSRRNAARAARAAQEQEPTPLPGVRATDALATERRLPPLPPPLPTPPHPEQPPAYPASPGGPDPFALDQLATDAAARAHALLSTGRDPVGELSLWQDAVRLAAARPGSGLTATTRSLYASLAKATGRPPGELGRAVAAWRQGGIEGLAVLEEPWDPPAGRFDRARPLLLAADLPAFRPWHNHLTHPHGHVQLRLGRDGLWYAYESEPGHEDWWPRGTPDLDPVGALTGLGAPGEL
ncbi:SWIM zinc finger family protein [Streptomyces sp. NPDC050549]|uniref:SWIM zinc finger family protein n=1 Tax=Streptomyces sp. NPDC050549 TaxID=3155406 RepID=UPI003431177D